MKLSTTHLFLILLFVLILGCCCCTNTNILEGYESKTYTGPQGNSATIATGSQGNSAVVTTNKSSNADGIKRSEIPPGDEDLYILKTEIVPPVCPTCPTYNGAGAAGGSCGRTEPCPACPPCARCPEPAFECKKVPNYSSNNDRFLPKPVLNDFSTFGS